MRGLPISQRTQFLTSLSKAEQAALLYTWEWWARPEQLAPPGDWYCWLILAGRGWGKTRTVTELVRSRVEAGTARRIALIGQTAADVRDVIVEGESGILAVSPPWCRPKYEPSKRRLTWPNGAIATTYSGDEPDQLRGPQHDLALCDELAKWRFGQAAWDNMEFGLRLGHNPQVIVATTPRPIPIIKALKADPQTVMPMTNLSTYVNIDNVAPRFVQRVVRRYEGTRLGRQELHAQILEDTPGALWNRAQLEMLRVTKAPPLQRVVTGIDPSNTSGGDEAGVITAGIGMCTCKGKSEQHGFLLDDASLQGSPTQWASAGVTAYHKFKADRLVAESNNGGEMVAVTIGTITGAPPVKLIHASRGKYTRAEPIASLYEQGKVHHVGAFPQLEDEYCSWLPGDNSPNRLDAAVWALTELMLGRSGGELFQ